MRIMIAYDIDRGAYNFTQITLRWSQIGTNFTFQAGIKMRLVWETIRDYSLRESVRFMSYFADAIRPGLAAHHWIIKARSRSTD